ncbi:MAG: ferritin family protein [candidate division Zixibacteria bacterium]|nr:ferritin family protein [candidate division Zixibacteria bacterium]
MNSDKEKVKEVLKRAIKGEEDGYYFYNLLSEKATNTDAKRKLQNLRDDELGHKRTLLAIYEKHVGGAVGPLPEKGLSVLSDIFGQGHTLQLKSEMEFLNLAIEAELAATQYYQRERNLIDDPEFGAVFDGLADEEHRHYELLMAEREALSGNYYWFGYGDTSPMED